MASVKMQTKARSDISVGRAGERSDPQLLAEWKTLLGELINSGARLRFFPHRAMMFLALAELSRAPAERAALLRSGEETIADFRRIATGIAVDHKAFGVSDGLSPWLGAMMADDRASFDLVVTTFTEGSVRILKALKRGDEDIRDELITVSQYVATDLLARMNKLVADFAAELKDVAAREEIASLANDVERRSSATSQARVIGLTDDLNRVNLTVGIISLNAGIQAAQAGNAGRGFGLIANEIQQLSGRIKALTLDIRAALGGMAGQ